MPAIGLELLILCVFKLIAILVVELSKTVIVLIDTCVHMYGTVAQLLALLALPPHSKKVMG